MSHFTSLSKLSLKLAILLAFCTPHLGYSAVSERDRAELGVEKNLLKNGGCESGTAGWTRYADAAGTSPVDGTGGSPNVTFSAPTSSPIDGSASCLLTKGAANRQGEGWAYNFTVQKTASPHFVTIDYQVASGTYDAGSDTTDPDITAWVYGPTDGTPELIQLAPYKVLGAAVGTNMRFSGRFQTAASGTAYRLILHESKTGTSAYTVKLEAKVSVESKTYGPPVTDAESYTPVITNDSGGITNYTATAKKWRVGDRLFVTGQIVFSTTSAAFSGIGVSLPSGLSIDTNKVLNTSQSHQLLGHVKALDAGVASYPSGTVQYFTATKVELIYGQIGTHAGAVPVVQGNFSNTTPITFNTNDTISFNFSVPIAGWSSTVAMSNDASNRVVAARYTTDAAQSVTNGANQIIGYEDKDYDTHGMCSGSGTGFSCVIPVPGKYNITAAAQATAAATANNQFFIVKIYKNGSSIAERGDRRFNTEPENGAIVSDTLNLVAGDIITIRVDHSITGAAITLSPAAVANFFSIFRLGGPEQISAGDTVAARYSRSTTQAIGNGATVVVDYATKDFDTFGMCTTGAAFKCTAPVKGIYQVNASIAYDSAAFSAGFALTLKMRKNGTDAHVMFHRLGTTGTYATSTIKLGTLVSLNAGDYVDFTTSHEESASRNTIGSAPEWVNMSIVKVGN